jgi:hypothetical protein
MGLNRHAPNKITSLDAAMTLLFHVSHGIARSAVLYSVLRRRSLGGVFAATPKLLVLQAAVHR